MVEHHIRGWFVRRGKKIAGPYHKGLVSRYILLGRIKLSDEISSDRENWRPVLKLPELIPDVMKGDMSDPMVQERLKAARRWADERDLDERRDSRAGDPDHGQSRGGDRRDYEDLESARGREARHRRGLGAAGRRQAALGWAVILVLITALSATGIYTYITMEPEELIDCGAEPAPGINWRNCKLPGIDVAGADLSNAVLRNAILTGARMQNVSLAASDVAYADLSLADLTNGDMRGTILVGASLKNARLRKADMRHANLGYTDFSGADIAGVLFEGANLSRAIWVDGRECAQGSLGQCGR